MGQPEIVVIDGYVWLGPDKWGLGAHLYDSMHQMAIVIGVAKSRFTVPTRRSTPVVHGASKSPLWVTSIGMDPVLAADSVRSMHGPHRIPTLIKRADQLCRGR